MPTLHGSTIRMTVLSEPSFRGQPSFRGCDPGWHPRRVGRGCQRDCEGARDGGAGGATGAPPGRLSARQQRGGRDTPGTAPRTPTLTGTTSGDRHKLRLTLAGHALAGHGCRGLASHLPGILEVFHNVSTGRDDQDADAVRTRSRNKHTVRVPAKARRPKHPVSKACSMRSALCLSPEGASWKNKIRTLFRTSSW